MNATVNIRIEEPIRLCEARDVYHSFEELRGKTDERKDYCEFHREYGRTVLINPKPEMIIFNRLKSIIPEISEDAKRKLLADTELLQSVIRVVENIKSIELHNFSIESIGIEYDPENPKWQVIIILIKIKENDIDKLLDIRDDIIIKAFEGIDIEYIKKICIVNIF